MKTHGFTLLELMIVVAIISFLASIGLPQYFKYQARARQAEVVLNLASLHTAQQTYFAENGRYAAVLNGPDGLGWKPEGYKGGGKGEGFYYTYGFSTPEAQEGVHYFTGKLGTTKESLGATHADKDSFVIRAAGIVSGDKVDVWSIDQSRNIQHIQNGLD